MIDNQPNFNMQCPFDERYIVPSICVSDCDNCSIRKNFFETRQPKMKNGKYNMSFEEAQKYIEFRGFDIPWNDCEVYIDSQWITQTVANILKWADEHPIDRK